MTESMTGISPDPFELTSGPGVWGNPGLVLLIAKIPAQII